MSDSDTLITDRTRLRRAAERGRHDFEAVAAVIDAGLVCHVGFALEGRPWVFPTAYGRINDRLYVHGAAANFGLRSLADGAEACVTVTILDGLVFGRSAFHHSMNYRSAMIFGQGEAVAGDEKLAATRAIVEHMAPGRWDGTRPPTDTELQSTLVVGIPIDEASAKVRTGPPIDEPDDLDLPHWAGVLPLSLAPSAPVPDAGVTANVPAHIADWSRS